MGMKVPGLRILGAGGLTCPACLCSHGLFFRIAGWPLSECTKGQEKRKMVSPAVGTGGSVRRVDVGWGNRVARVHMCKGGHIETNFAGFTIWTLSLQGIDTKAESLGPEI